MGMLAAHNASHERRWLQFPDEASSDMVKAGTEKFSDAISGPSCNGVVETREHNRASGRALGFIKLSTNHAWLGTRNKREVSCHVYHCITPSGMGTRSIER